MSKKKERESYKILSKDDYLSRFAMMLRCSYSCLATEVAFVNASPMITFNTAKRVRAAPILSEWVGGMIEIHEISRIFFMIIEKKMGKDRSFLNLSA